MLLLSVISILMYFIFKVISKKTGIPALVFYLILGFALKMSILNSEGFSTIFNEQFLKNLSFLTTMSTLLLFFNSGYAMDFTKLKLGGKKGLLLSIFPAYAEIIVGVIISSLILLVILPLFGNQYFTNLTIWELIFCSGLLALSSAVIAIPHITRLFMKHDKSSVLSYMLVPIVLDVFFVMPLLLVVFNVIIYKEQATFMFVTTQVFSQILTIVVCSLIYYFSGKYIARFLNKILGKINLLFVSILIALLVFLSIIIPSQFISLISDIGFFVTLALGFGFGSELNLNYKMQIQKYLGIIFMVLFFPLQFLFVGMQIKLEFITQLELIIPVIIIVLCSALTKGFVANKILKDVHLIEEEQKFIYYSFLPKGIVLVNISIVIQTVLEKTAPELLNYMLLIIVVSIIGTIPYSSYSLDKIKFLRK